MSASPRRADREQRRRCRGRRRRRRSARRPGRRRAAATPSALASVPSMPLAPRLESTRGASSRTGQNDLELAHRHRRGDEQRRLARAARSPSARATFGLAELRRRAPSATAAPARASALAPAGEPGRIGGRRAAPSSARIGAQHELDDGGGVLPGAAAGRRGSGARRRGRRASRAAAWRSAGRRRGSRPPGACARGERGVAQQQVVVGDRGVAAARARERVGEQRVAGGGARAPGARARGRRRRARRRSRRARAPSMWSRETGGGRARRARRATHGPPAGAPAGERRRRPAGTSGSRSAQFRCTGPGRSPVAAATARQASARIQRSRSRRRVVVADLEEPAHRVAVELDLVDRLAGADLAQLGRAVGGQHDQRHARLARPRSRPARGSPRRCRRCR